MLNMLIPLVLLVQDRRLNAPACDGSDPVCSCPAGQYVMTPNNQCVNCPSGYWSAYPDGFYAQSCIECHKGQAEYATGQTSCDDCLAGKYSDDTGLTACKPCEAGKFQGGTGMNACAIIPGCLRLG